MNNIQYNLLDDLNESQRLAVQCVDAPSLVIAGAGSGKTRVLTYKIAYLLQQGLQPWNILALTFTNKAAEEMKQRISRQVGEELASRLWMGTFHSVFSRILRTECQYIGFTSDFTIYDAADQKSLIRGIIREMQLDDKKYKPGLVVNHISQAKNRLITPDGYARDAEILKRDASMHVPAIQQIYQRYVQRCRLSNAMDFDDLLLYTYYLFLHHPEVAQKYEERFEFVLVDEYQDTNYAQHSIVWQLTQHRQRVCVVGDDAQSIYGFRGANIENILTFQQLYKQARLFKLEQNYRSTQTIVAAANSLIRHNAGQIPKDVFSKKAAGNLIQVLCVQSDYEESIMVSRKISGLHQREHVNYNDIAILYRTNAQSRSLEDALRKDGLPYRIFGGLSFYQRKEIKDVIAYLRLAVNPRDEEAMKRVINYPARGIGETTMARILECATSHGVSPWNVLCDPAQYQLPVNKGTMTKLTNFARFIEGFAQVADKEDADTLAFRMVKESKVGEVINQGTEPDDVSRQENLQELLDGIAAFVESRKEEGNSCLLTDFLQEVSLLSDVDEDKSNEGEKITLMTVHSAKGLEFRVVFVVGLEEELFPNQMALQDGARGLEEERRLMYVAMTRAEEQLFFSTAKSRFRFGKTELSTPSRFLKEIDSRYLQVNRRSGGASSAPSFTSRSFTPGAPRPFASDSSQSFGSGASHSFASESPRTNASESPRPFGFGSSQSFASGSSRTNIPGSSQGFTTSSASGRTLVRVGSSSNPRTQIGNSSAFPGSLSSSTSSTSPISPISPISSGSSFSFASSSASAPSSATSQGGMAVGKHVEHSRFGRGEILSLEGSGLDAKATVRFDNVGTKQLLLRFAKLTLLD